MFKRRIGPGPHPNSSSAGANSCPDIWELENGDFAIIGDDRTAELGSQLPPTAFLDPGEGIVVIPRHILTKARDDIPEA